ncbi:MAG: hypothetical protein HY912_18495 [Desulfomonile tiedjei]|uniref:Uncharacterized protein n=1 Tax=Desulfomonile tiedjei TaxID=2358 RepID=A0A9D6V415_9BACT|nr:hypothetical protein [Desulfomonile tiedjei]
MSTKPILMAFLVLAVAGSLNSAYAFPYFILQRPSGNLMVVDGRSSYSNPVVGGPYTSAAEARAALDGLKHIGNVYGSAALREQPDRISTSSSKRNGKPQEADRFEGPVSLSSLGTRSTVVNAPLATLPLADLSERFSDEELAFAAQLYSPVPAFPELSSFQLSQFPGAVGPSALAPIPMPRSTAASIPFLPQPGFSVPQIQVPLSTVPALPSPVFTSPLPLAIGWR